MIALISELYQLQEMLMEMLIVIVMLTLLMKMQPRRKRKTAKTHPSWVYKS